MTARLVSLDGHPDILLDQTVVLIGRHGGCDVRIDSSRVSRRHCCVVLEQDHLVVRDLDSTNGTWVNGLRVLVARMNDGDELVVGRARYRLSMEPTPAGERPGPFPNRREPESIPYDDDSSGLGTWRVEIDPDDLGCRPPG